jgi:hypothetical protein
MQFCPSASHWQAAQRDRGAKYRIIALRYHPRGKCDDGGRFCFCGWSSFLPIKMLTSSYSTQFPLSLSNHVLMLIFLAVTHQAIGHEHLCMFAWTS